ncbi:MAG: DeoR/GlpR family DNA-binding transcription regulator, partial [Hyphomicrobiales bacterium]
VTNNINVVHILRTARLKSLIIVGGEVRPSDGAIIGNGAIDAFRNYKVDFAVIGASSLDTDGSILDFDQREVAVSRAILANARTRILVCDRSKFSVSAPHRICNVNELDFIVTDTQPPLEFEAAAKHAKTTLIVTDDGNETE